MKFVRYLHEKSEGYGILTENGKVLCMPSLAKRLNKQAPRTLEGFIRTNSGKKAEKTLRNASRNFVDKASLPLDKVKLLAPIVNPPKIICLGLNYRDHAAEQNAPIPEEPIIFFKPRTAIVGPYGDIVKPSFVKSLDYEAELAVVVGEKAKNVSISEAERYIFGYTVLNDVSARDIQFKDKQWTRGKSFDTFAPMGPCIVTKDQVGNVLNLRIRTWVNGELRQNSTTKNMVFNVYEVIHHLSKVMTLEPCDVIATGTPAGVGFAMKPEAKFLNSGDIVKIEIENIGVLENRVVEVKP